MASKYPTAELIGVVVQQANDGQYALKENKIDQVTFHSWRIGKHTKGKLLEPGQLFLTENNLFVMLIAIRPLAFKNRHDFNPISRFLTTMGPESLKKQLLTNYTS
ncbi:DUF7671 family protein [Weissella hellenica]|uniref:DUF7671 domain-containing protein n=1 Tax=Weissella hellenica TaxID=46256 RepID=A0A4Y4G7P6_WEIHE|nr:hypothetical protein [Weissella hellenica]NKY66727.1 hypothetical protein [Weissella hellenica]GED36011.1 hypothetical protein WHE01_09150 [Weissella hellenica]SCB86924.1 hypothetical protein GA0061075_104112 [Weissella hellenica]